jgi:uncharacterized protein YyaL (SSP411 family)
VRRNRLAAEKSPYLIHHSTNPVDWYPWGEEAFRRASAEDRPLFVSIGYSACHWCHVMERESFEDPDVARILNDSFVCVKVDREERPDVDSVYMDACVAMTGRGGWPLTIVATPEGDPFFAATYLPRESRFGLRGLTEVARDLARIWTERRGAVLQAARAVVNALEASQAAVRPGDLGPEASAAAARDLAASFDGEKGGFGSAPKFPAAHRLTFLLRRGAQTRDPSLIGMAVRTLDAMRRGGIYDQLGFGFHRYSTDASWRVPHFEKMLYDQALLAMTYAEARLATGDQRHGRTALEILAYVERELTSPEGAFFSSEDADVDGVEGGHYLWTADEIRRVLGPADAALASEAFGVTEEGNMPREDEYDPRANVLFLARSPGEIARARSTSPDEVAAALESARARLAAARSRRPRPARDDKILADWNGLAIAAFAFTGRALGERRLGGTAAKAADFVLARMVDGRGRLLHRYRDGEAAVEAHADDYAFLVWGLLELYEATFEVCRLEQAIRLSSEFASHFWDDARGGFFLSADDATPLPVRKKEIHDGALPAANSVAALNLLRLARITGEPEYERMAAAIPHAFASRAAARPSDHAALMTAVDLAHAPTTEVVVAGAPGDPRTRSMLEAASTVYPPDPVVIARPPGEAPPIGAVAPWVLPLTPLDGAPAAYVCRSRSCARPTTDLAEMLAAMES